jgi:antitoxin ParD1/3/4
MIVGMSTERITVSLPADLVADVRQLVAAGQAPSVSAYVAEALRQKVTREDVLAMLDDILADSGGPLGPEELAEIDAELSG